MRVLVLSDTHIPATAKKLPPIIEKEAKASDCCLHSGDFIDYSIFQILSNWTKTYGVYGNMDDEYTKKELPEKGIIKLEGVTLGLIHGAGRPRYLIEYINKEFVSEMSAIDIFVFGHSHIPQNEEINGKIYFNPGSPTDKIFAPYCSYGILDIDSKQIKRRIVKIG